MAREPVPDRSSLRRGGLLGRIRGALLRRLGNVRGTPGDGGGRLPNTLPGSLPRSSRGVPARLQHARNEGSGQAEPRGISPGASRSRLRPRRGGAGGGATLRPARTELPGSAPADLHGGPADLRLRIRGADGRLYGAHAGEVFPLGGRLPPAPRAGAAGYEAQPGAAGGVPRNGLGADSRAELRGSRCAGPDRDLRALRRDEERRRPPPDCRATPRP